jgi:hypothetical protein
VLLVAVTTHAASPEQTQENKGQELPVVATVPADEAVKVRPDTAVSFQLDTQSPEFRAFRQQLESGRFAIQVEGGASTQLFLGEQRSNGKDKGQGPAQPSAGEATFDAQTGTVSTPALSLSRYTTYTVTLAVKAAYQALLHGQPLPGNDSVSFAFITGSALREPTRYGTRIYGEQPPRVTGKVTLTVSAIDDYGNAASGANLVVTLTEDGSRLPSSAVSTPARATLPTSGADFVITDTEAEGVMVSVQASGAHPENAWSFSYPLRFRPGLPSKALLTDLPAQAQVGTYLTVKGTVVDVYGNAVEDGTPVSVGGQSVTTEAGAFSVTQLLPTLVSDYTVQVRSGFTLLGSAVVRLLPGDPAAIRELSAPYSMVVGSSFDISGQVTDAYGNIVLDGTKVTVNGASTTTKTGFFSVPVTAPTKPGSFTLAITAGRMTTSQTVHVRSGPPSAITGVTVPESVVVGSKLNVCGAVEDSYGNAVTDGTSVTVNAVTTTTKSGAFCASLTVPTRPGSLPVLIKAGTLSLSQSTQVRSGPPAVFSNVTAPDSTIVGSGFNVCGQVADAYGNTVSDGTAVTVNGETVTTTGGAFCASLLAPTKPGSLPVLINAGPVSLTKTVQVNIGPAAAFINLTIPDEVIVGNPFTACGQVADAYGNVLPTGTVVKVNGSTVTATSNGIFCASVSVPTKPGTLNVVLQSGTLSLTKVVQVRTGDPASIDNVSSPASAVVGTKASVCGFVWDAYYNAVPLGTAVTVNGVATTTVAYSTTLKNYFCASVTMPTTVGSFLVTIKSGTVTRNRSILAISGVVAAITDLSVPETVEFNATFQACATAKDAYGNLVADGAKAYVSGGVTSSILTSTVAGRFCAQLKAPNYATAFGVSFTVYEDRVSTRSVTVNTSSRAVPPGPANVQLMVNPSNDTVPPDGSTGAYFDAYVTDKNGAAVANGFPGTWTTTLGTLTVTRSTTSGGIVSAVLRSSVAGTATVTVTVGSITKSLNVTFATPPPVPVAAYVSNVYYAQPNGSCYGADATYTSFGHGTYFRPLQSCTLSVYGTAYTSTGALAKKAVVSVKVSVEGYSYPTTTTATTDSNGNFIAYPYVPSGYGARTYSYSVWDSYYWRYRWVTDYWDWGNVTISSSSGQSLFTDKLYAVKYRYPY